MTRWLAALGQFRRWQNAAEMKLVGVSKLSDGQRLTFRRDRGERRLDPVGEAVAP